MSIYINIFIIIILLYLIFFIIYKLNESFNSNEFIAPYWYGYMNNEKKRSKCLDCDNTSNLPHPQKCFDCEKQGVL